MKRFLATFTVACTALFVSLNSFAQTNSSPANTILAIARDIEGLKAGHPQLQVFSAINNTDASRLRIEYKFKTHAPSQHGGWTSGVPNPDNDGIWLFIDFHDPKSSAEIHNQPLVIRPKYFGDKAVSFLLLEGSDTKPVRGAIEKILADHGITTNQPPVH